MQMKRKAAGLMLGILSLSLALSVTGCGIKGGQYWMRDRMGGGSLPDKYLITYEVCEVGVVWQITKCRDVHGNVYFKSADVELLFIADGDKYTQYIMGIDGKWHKDVTEKYSAGDIEERTKGILEYAGKSGEEYLSVATEAGTAEVAGRACQTYEIEIQILNYSQTYILSIDDETNICLGWQTNTLISQYDVSAHSVSFFCLEYITESTELPALEDKLLPG